MPYGSGTVVVASASVNVPVGILLLRRNMLSLYEQEMLRGEYMIPDCVGLRLSTPTKVVRYPWRVV